jgi:Smg protein
MDSSFRVLGPHERGRFAPEAWGHLLSLRESGAISRVELEQVIERALSNFDGRIALEDLRILIDSSLFDDGGPSSDSPTVH